MHNSRSLQIVLSTTLFITFSYCAETHFEPLKVVIL
jgi:hypothetical protein